MPTKYIKFKRLDEWLNLLDEYCQNYRIKKQEIESPNDTIVQFTDRDKLVYTLAFQYLKDTCTTEHYQLRAMHIQLADEQNNLYRTIVSYNVSGCAIAINTDGFYPKHDTDFYNHAPTLNNLSINDDKSIDIWLKIAVSDSESDDALGMEWKYQPDKRLSVCIRF